MRLLLNLYDSLQIIVSVVSVIVTILLCSIGGEKSKRRNKTCFIVAVLIAISSVAISFAIMHTNKLYAYIPDLYGTTYDDAVNALHKAGFKGRLALASTNENLAYTDARVIWQSIPADGITPKGELVTFVIDDCFAFEYTPLFAVESSSSSSTWDWIADKTNSHWQITMPVNREHANATSTSFKGVLTTTVEWYRDDISSESMCKAFLAMIEESCEASERNIGNDSVIIGKLIPQFECEQVSLSKTELTDTGAVFFLPQVLSEGNYSLCFSIINSDGTSCEWSHNIELVSYDTFKNIIS